MKDSTEKNAQASAPERYESRVMEAFEELWGTFVDPHEAFAGDGEELWSTLNGRGAGSSAAFTPPQLEQLRTECRRLAIENEFAINGHENRISYLVGTGHLYQASVRKGSAGPEEHAQHVQEVIDEFMEENDWHARQQEIVRRMDRDGEVFLRWFASADGRTAVRFIDPEQVATPNDRALDPAASHGVLTDPRDVETVRGYFVDGTLLEADQVQHRKSNVDRNVKRGLPLYTAVRGNLRRADRLLRNMSVLAEIQTAIALIRKHRNATRSGVERFVADASTAESTDRYNRVKRVTQYGPGTILDAPAGLDYQFPTTGIDAGSYVTILQAELRAIAARLVMPEFMFTSDASNASYASTMVAEGPAVKMFSRLQASMIADDRKLLRVVLRNAVRAGRLSELCLTHVQLQVEPPTLRVRDRLQETQIDRIAYEKGVLSPQTWSQRLGFDYEQEQLNRRMHEKSANAALPGA
ncbi:phage portal protein [Botrimarina hoheduenensis]|uniref:Phage portal protein, lambda family n=1 Tax=Botrimarina hoheduenensis TaxID=2528000 RepID=A0A5C5W6A0_9BACT|nr:phage portal protein [Botrimarina hoheduenensis]TWT46498.1 Phage portal protein, lambda family [Botrimarina hoheduenensis]